MSKCELLGLVQVLLSVVSLGLGHQQLLESLLIQVLNAFRRLFDRLSEVANLVLKRTVEVVLL